MRIPQRYQLRGAVMKNKESRVALQIIVAVSGVGRSRYILKMDGTGVFIEAPYNRPAVLKAVIHPSLYAFDNTELGL